MHHLKRLKINVFIISDTLKCSTQWISIVWSPKCFLHMQLLHILFHFSTLFFRFFLSFVWRLGFPSNTSWISSLIFILFMKTSHAFSLSKDWFIFNFHKKLPLDEGKKNQTLLWCTKILQKFTSKMIYQIQNIYKARYSNYFLLTIVQNHTTNFFGMVECMNMKM